MPDLLALIDAGIDALEREASSRCSRLHGEVQGSSGTPNPLDGMSVPVVPIVPIRRPEVQGLITNPADAEGNNKKDRRAREAYLKSAGITGTTGTDEDFCWFPFTNEVKENGNEREHGARETGGSREPAQITAVGEPAICSDIEDEYANLAEPLMLRDGRRMWRFRARPVLSARPDFFLVEEARRHRVVLVADGNTLAVVEPWLSTLPGDILREMKEQAGAVIAALRNAHCGRHP